MGKFFEKIIKHNKRENWGNILDWLSNDLKFSNERNWNKGYKSKLTRKIKTLSGLSNNDKHIIHGTFKKADFPNQNNKKKKNSKTNKEICIMMVNGAGFAEDLIRHIRNGIFHGESEISGSEKSPNIKIIDYSHTNKKEENQSAYIYFPLIYIKYIFDFYNEINKSIMNTKEKDRRNTNKIFKKKKIINK